MLGNILLSISFLLGALVVLLGAMDAWLRSDQQLALRDWFQAAWIRVADADRLRFALQPLHFLSLLLDRLLGTTLSSRAFKRAFLISALLLISLLSALSILSQIPSAKISMPSRFYSASSDVAKKLLSTPSFVTNAAAFQTNAAIATVIQRTEFLASHDTSFWRTAYTACFFLCVTLLGALLGALSVTVTRQHLRELLEAKGIMTLIAGLALNLLIVALLASFFLVMICLVAVPVLWPALPGLAFLAQISIFWTFVAASLGSMVLWKLSTVWFRLAAIVAVLPSFVLLVTLACSALLFPFRQSLLDSTGTLLLRIVESKRDPLAFIARMLAVLLFIAGVVVKALGK